jgi:threonine synthase
VAVPDTQLIAGARELETAEGIDAAPEGGATLAGALELKQRGALTGAERVVLLNTGAGWLYRS